MSGFIRLDRPLPLTDLLGLEYDGLLQRLTRDVWVAAGTIADPALRCAALGAAPRPSIALSHRSAHWVWWGSSSGRAPALTEYTTFCRRRMRSSRGSWTVYERDVLPAERVEFDGQTVTSPERTLYDLLRAALLAPDPVATGQHTFARVPHADRQSFLAWLDGIERRPYAARTRALALATIGREPSPALTP